MNYGKLSGGNTSSNTKPKPSGLRPPWPKGVSGNPNGRPKSKPISDMLRPIFDDPNLVAEIRANVSKTLRTKGMAGVILLNHIADRLEGKVPDELQIKDLRDMSDEELEKEIEALESERRATGKTDRGGRAKARTGAAKARA